MKRISIKGAGWDSMFLAVGKVLTMLFTIVSAKMLSVGLSLTEYGTYSQANLVNTVGRSLILLGLGDALNYFFNSRQENIEEKTRQRIVNTVFFLELFVGLILAVCVIGGQNILAAYFGNQAVKKLLPVVAFLPVLSNLIYFYQIVYVAVGKAKLMSLYSIIMTVVRIITIYIAVYVLKNLLLIYIVMVIQDLVQLLIYNITLSKKKVHINPFKISKAHIGTIFAYGLPMGIYAITSELTRDLDKLVIGRLAGTDALAIYTNCSKLLPVDVIVTSFALVLIPYITRYVTEKNREKSIDLLSSYMKVGYYSVWILGTMLLISPATMVSFLYDDKYLPGTIIFILYVFDSMLRFASMHLVLTAANKAKTLMIYSIGSLILNFVLNIGCYYLFGLVGPAIATLISAVVYTWLVMRKSIQCINARWTEIFHVKEISLFGLSIGCLWLICYLICKGFFAIGLHPYIAMIISMALFGCGALAMHFKKISGVLKKINTFRI